MLTESPESDDRLDNEHNNQLLTNLHIRWSEHVLTGMQYAMDHDNLSFELRDQFDAYYPITQWTKILSKVLEIFLPLERYEDCATCKSLLDNVKIKLLTLTDEELRTVEQTKRQTHNR